MAFSVVLSANLVQAEISQQLLDVLALNFVQITFTDTF